MLSRSLSFQHNTSQERMLQALQELNKHLEESDRAASHPYSTSFLDPADNHLVTNLKGLVRAAQNFHARSSTATSISSGQQGGRRDFTSSNDSYAQSVAIPKIPSFKKRQIEMFVSKTRRLAGTGSNSMPGANVYMPSIVAYTDDGPEVVESELQDSFEVNSDSLLSKGLSKMAQKELRELKLPEAERTLQQAVERHRITDPDDPHHRHLRIQLALCTLLQGNVQQAEDSILDLVEFRTNNDLLANQLLYALALAQTHECNFAATIAICKRLWQSFQDFEQPTTQKETDIWRLLAISHRESGGELLSRALEEVCPDLDLQTPLPTVADFISSCEELLVEFFRLGKTIRVSTLLVHRMKQLPVFQKTTPLQKKLATRNRGQDENATDSSAHPGVSNNEAFLEARPYSKPRYCSARYLRTCSNRRNGLVNNLFIRGNAFKRAKSLLSSISNSSTDSASYNKPQRRKPVRRVHKSRLRHSRVNSQDIIGTAARVLGVSAVVLFAPVSVPIMLYCRRRYYLRNGYETNDEANDETRVRIRAWISGQDSNKASTPTKESPSLNYDEVEPERFPRKFSFEGFPTTPTTGMARCFRMPYAQRVELMDTSPRVELSDTEIHPIDIINKHNDRPDEITNTVTYRALEDEKSRGSGSDSGYESENIQNLGEKQTGPSSRRIPPFPTMTERPAWWVRCIKHRAPRAACSGGVGHLAFGSMGMKVAAGEILPPCVEYFDGDCENGHPISRNRYFGPKAAVGPFTLNEDAPYGLLNRLTAARAVGAVPFGPDDIVMPIEIGDGQPDPRRQLKKQTQQYIPGPVASFLKSQRREVYELPGDLDMPKEEPLPPLSHPGSPPGSPGSNIRRRTQVFSRPNSSNIRPLGLFNGVSDLQNCYNVAWSDLLRVDGT